MTKKIFRKAHDPRLSDGKSVALDANTFNALEAEARRRNIVPETGITGIQIDAVASIQGELKTIRGIKEKRARMILHKIRVYGGHKGSERE